MLLSEGLKPREPWSSGYGRQLMIARLWVQILENWMDITFFTVICCKNYIVFERDRKKRKRGRGWPIFLKNLAFSTTQNALKEEVINLCRLSPGNFWYFKLSRVGVKMFKLVRCWIGYEPQTSCVGIDHSANRLILTALVAQKTFPFHLWKPKPIIAP